MAEVTRRASIFRLGRHTMPDFGDQFQPQPTAIIPSAPDWRDAARGWWGLEVRVAEARFRPCEELALAEHGEIGDQRLFVLGEDFGARTARGARVGALGAGRYCPAVAAVLALSAMVAVSISV